MEEKDKEKQSSIKMTANGIKYESKHHSVAISKDGKIRTEQKLTRNQFQLHNLNTISSLLNVLTVLSNLEKEPPNKIEIYGSGQIAAEIEDE